MRYYDITITNGAGQSLIPTADGFSTGTGSTFSSLGREPFTGKLVPDPGALNVEFDIPVTTMARPQGSATIKIWGVGLRMLSQAHNLAGMSFSMRAGMSAGLPLANPAQAGIILQGKIFQSFGNWEGTNQTLDLIVINSPPPAPDGIYRLPVPFFWAAGSPLNEAIAQAIAVAYPGFKSNIHIDPGLTLANDEAGYYQTFAQFANYLHGLTLKLGSQYIQNYQGVQFAAAGTVINVWDGTQPRGPSSINVPLNFQDLIGQPTWLTGTTISVQTVLRADISLGNTITFPTGILAPYALTSPQGISAQRTCGFPQRFSGKVLGHRRRPGTFSALRRFPRALGRLLGDGIHCRGGWPMSPS